MPDEAIEAPVDQDAQDATSAENGAPAPEEPAVDWEKRYSDQRSEFDRRGSELTNYRFQDEALRGEHGPEQQALAFQRAGVEVQQAEEEVDDDPFEDPYEKRIGTLEQRLAAKEEAEQEAEATATEQRLVKDALKGFEKEGTVTLTDRDKKIIESNALINRWQFQSVDDLNAALKGAFDDLMAVKGEARDGYIASKKAPRAPVGSAGEAKIDFSKMSKDEIDQWMAEDIESRMEQS
jgi:hypothetical protein